MSEQATQTPAVSKYQRLDDAICEHIRAGGCHPTQSMALVAIVREMADAGQIMIGRRSPVYWRVIDRRMQAMRKAGVLTYEKSAWGGPAQWRVADRPAEQTT